jgi:hypothetical protein
MQIIQDFILRQGLEFASQDSENMIFLEEYGWYLKLKKIKNPSSLKAKFITAIFFLQYLDKFKKPPHWKLKLWAYLGRFLGYRI